MGTKKKLAFTTLGCPEWSFKKILKEAHEMGYSGIEIRGLGGKMLAEEIAEFFPENRESTLAALKAKDLELICFGSSVKFDDAGNFEAAISEGKKAIDVCQFMGIPAIRIFADKIPAGESEAEMTARVARGSEILAEYGKDKGVLVLLETHGDFITLELIKGIFDQAKSENLKILWDVGNTDKIYGDSFEKFYEPMKDKIAHTHFKDFDRGTGDANSYKHCDLGKGQIPIKAIVKKLIEDGYNGYFCLEWEKKWHPELAAAERAFPEFVRILNEV